MDDASGNGIKTGNKKDSAYRLYTSSFTLEENEMISNYFSNLGFENKVKTYTNSSRKQYYCIKFSLDASRKLTGFISPYFADCLRYKLVPTFEEVRVNTIDTDKLSKIIDNRKFSWENADKSKRIFNTVSEFRAWGKEIQQALSVEVTKIERLSEGVLVDIFVKKTEPHLSSFYINSKKLVHNSQRAHVGCIS